MSTTAIGPFSSVMTNASSPAMLEQQLINIMDGMGNTTNAGMLKNDLLSFEKQYPAVNVSGLISFIDATIRNLESFMLLDGISAFVTTINGTLPHVAQHYEHIAEEGVHDMIQYFNTTTTLAPTSKPTTVPSHDRSKRMIIPQIDFFDRLINLINVQSDINNAYMTPQLLNFLRGFAAMRTDFALSFHQGFETTEDARKLGEQIRQPQRMADYLREYNEQVVQLLAQAQYQALGRLAFKINVLNFINSEYMESVVGTNLMEAFVYMVRDFLSKIEQLTFASSSFPLSIVIMYGFTWNPLQLLTHTAAVSEGVCMGDVISLAIASYAGATIPAAVKNLVNSIFWGSGYAELPFLVRLILQELTYQNWLDDVDDSKFFRLNMKIKTASNYVKKITDLIDTLVDKLNDGVPFDSIKVLLDQMVAAFNKKAATLPADADVSTQLQIGVSRVGDDITHAIFAELKRVAQSFSLTVCDTRIGSQGLVWVDGESLDELVANAMDMLEPLATKYGFPMRTAGTETGTVSQPSEELLNTLENMQVIPDSALTLKDIMTNDIADLQTLDHIAIKALAKRFFDRVTSPEGLEKLKLPQKDKLEDLEVPESETTVTTSDPLVMQMREVLSVLEDAIENNTAVPEAIKQINAHIMLQTSLSMQARAQAQTPQEPEQPAHPDVQEPSAMETDAQYGMEMTVLMDALNALCPAINGAALAAGVAQAAAEQAPGGRAADQQGLSVGERVGVALGGAALGAGGLAVLRDMLSSLRSGGAAGGESFSLTARVSAREVQEVMDDALTDYIVEHAPPPPQQEPGETAGGESPGSEGGGGEEGGSERGSERGSQRGKQSEGEIEDGGRSPGRGVNPQLACRRKRAAAGTGMGGGSGKCDSKWNNEYEEVAGEVIGTATAATVLSAIINKLGKRFAIRALTRRILIGIAAVIAAIITGWLIGTVVKELMKHNPTPTPTSGRGKGHHTGSSGSDDDDDDDDDKSSTTTASTTGTTQPATNATTPTPTPEPVTHEQVDVHSIIADVSSALLSQTTVVNMSASALSSQRAATTKTTLLPASSNDVAASESSYPGIENTPPAPTTSDFSSISSAITSFLARNPPSTALLSPEGVTGTQASSVTSKHESSLVNSSLVSPLSSVAMSTTESPLATLRALSSAGKTTNRLSKRLRRNPALQVADHIRDATEYVRHDQYPYRKYTVNVVEYHVGGLNSVSWQ